MQKVTVLGAGSWGTALAILLANNGHDVQLWGRESNDLNAMQQARCNTRFLPEQPFPDNLRITVDFDAAVKTADIILIAIPSSGFRELLKRLQPFNKPIIWASKGIEPGSNKLLHQVIAEELGENYPCALLTGPSFAKEVASGLPTAIVVAADDKHFADKVMQLFANPQFRPYYSADVIGAEVGGSVKNVLAIAAGISDGLGYGANARAALITRGLNEMQQLGIALGAKPETFMGLSCLGDLVLTCTDNLSRNRRFGLALGQGKTAKEAFVEIGQVVEGSENVTQVAELAQQHALSMPITEHVKHVLEQTMTPKDAVSALFERDLKDE